MEDPLHSLNNTPQWNVSGKIVMAKLKLMGTYSCTFQSTKYEKETFSKLFAHVLNFHEMFLKQVTKFGEWSHYIHVINTVTNSITIAIV